MSEEKPKKAHRGPSKQGKHPVVVHLDSDELTVLTNMAESACRSLTQQARYFVLKGIREEQRNAGVES